MPVAIVTGAARGIGAAIARALFTTGHDLVLVDRCSDDSRLDYPLASAADLEAVVADCQAQHVIGDVTDPATTEHAVNIALERHGRVDVAVAAAGVIAGGDAAWQTNDEAWQVMLDVNLTGTVQLARAAIPAMLSLPTPRSARFVALSSSVATKATPLLAGYAASKAATQSFVRSMAADLGGTGVTANVVQPGATDTALLQYSASIYNLSSASEFAQHHIDQRLVDPASVATTVAWLCSTESAAITGAVIAADHGMTAR